MTNSIKNSTELKRHLFNECCQFVEKRLQTIKNTIHDIQESLDSETKSSAGDKHETGRAMLQIDLEKALNQLSEIKKSKITLSKIDVTKTSKTICLGSVVYTTKANYFIALSTGEFKINNNTFFAISLNTPIGKLLLGKEVNEVINFRNETFKIIKLA